MTLLINPGKILLTNNTDGRTIFSTDNQMPHIVGKASGTVTFTGPRVYYASADTSNVAKNVFIADYQAWSLSSPAWNFPGARLIAFIKINSGGYAFNTDFNNKWLCVQGSLLTRVWGSIDPNSQATGQFYAPTGFGGGELYTISLSNGNISIIKTVVAGNALITNPIGTGIDDLLGRTNSFYEWPSPPIASFAATMQYTFLIYRT